MNLDQDQKVILRKAPTKLRNQLMTMAIWPVLLAMGIKQDFTRNFVREILY
jgi:hypothetical protein